MFHLFKISGHSMVPTFSPGDTVVVSALPYVFRSPKTNDIIAFRNKGKIFIKRIVQIKDGRIIVAGDNMKDSLHVDPISKTEILGKTVWKI